MPDTVQEVDTGARYYKEKPGNRKQIYERLDTLIERQSHQFVFRIGPVAHDNQVTGKICAWYRSR